MEEQKILIAMITVKLFGITREIVGEPVLTLEDIPKSVGHLVISLKETYPKMGQLNSLLVAVNNEYAANDQSIHENDEIALIPPVSGG
jgi:molybdopterin converting factor subunit 1